MRRLEPGPVVRAIAGLHVVALAWDYPQQLSIAGVALARRLAGILYAVLRDGTVFDPRRAPRHAPVTTLSA